MSKIIPMSPLKYRLVLDEDSCFYHDEEEDRLARYIIIRSVYACNEPTSSEVLFIPFAELNCLLEKREFLDETYKSMMRHLMNQEFGVRTADLMAVDATFISTIEILEQGCEVELSSRIRSSTEIRALLIKFFESGFTETSL